jgi:hypothetical protein
MQATGTKKNEMKMQKAFAFYFIEKIEDLVLQSS